MHRYRKLLLASLILPLTACAAPVSGPGARLALSVAPLTLPGVGKVCYDLRATDGATKDSPTVWQKGTPGLNGGSGDSDAICSSNFGNGVGGDVTFIGACVASPVDAGQTGRTNSVTLWVDGVYDSSNAYVSPTGADGWQNPCPDGCTLTTLCRENADATLEFNLTILRQANQGFFDIAVNFEDIFCSAKVDCVDSASQPLKLLFRPGTSTRDTTVVSAFACTAGPGASINTVLYRDPLVVTCGGTTTTLPPNVGKGNAWATAAADPNPADAIWQYAIYADTEDLNCGGQPCNKMFWNVALGLDPTVDNCHLTTRMTASAGPLYNFSTPTASTYPYINVDLDLTDLAGLECTKHELNAQVGVDTFYTPITTPETFDYSFNGSSFGVSSNALPLEEVAPDKLLAYWPFDESIGLTAADMSGNARDATLSGGVALGATGEYATAMSFDGVDDKVSLSEPLLTGTTDFTLSAWVNRTSNAGVDYIMGNYGAGSCSNGIELYTNQGHIDVYLGATYVSSTGTLLTNRLYHIAATRKSGLVTIYVDGVSVYSQTAADSIGGSCNWTLGNGPNYTTEAFGGIIDDARVYRRALSAAEITALAGIATPFALVRSNPAASCQAVFDSGLTTSAPYFVTESSQSVLTYCDMSLKRALCSENQASRTGQTKDPSALDYSFVSILRPLTGFCEVWAVRGTSDNYPLDRFRGSTAIGTCAGLGFIKDGTLRNCPFGANNTQHFCGYPLVAYFRYGDLCSGCSAFDGSHDRYRLQGPMLVASIMSSFDGAIRSECDTR